MITSLTDACKFTMCSKCRRRALKIQWDKNLGVCPNCGHYLPISARQRLAILMDKNSFKELDQDMSVSDPLSFPDYSEKAYAQEEKSGLKEAVVTGHGKIGGIETTIAILDSRFFMGSMSLTVGEKITRAIEYATVHKTPLIIFSASGGARMQEGIYSLMQMIKTSDAIQRFSSEGLLYISFLTHPTTGGVTASFATLGDITLAEPEALIGFAGPRVIEQTIHEKLPEGFQRASYLEKHGFVDKIVPRSQMRSTLIDLLMLHVNTADTSKAGIFTVIK